MKSKVATGINGPHLVNDWSGVESITVAQMVRLGHLATLCIGPTFYNSLGRKFVQ